MEVPILVAEIKFFGALQGSLINLICITFLKSQPMVVWFDYQFNLMHCLTHACVHVCVCVRARTS